MGFNAGAFAGALGTSALNTFTRLEENSRAAQKAQQDAEVHEAWRKEQQQQADLASNYNNYIGSTETTQRQAIPGTIGVGEEGPVAQMQDVPYTAADKKAGWNAANRAANIDPMKAMQVEAASRTNTIEGKKHDLMLEYADLENTTSMALKNKDLPGYVSAVGKAYSDATGHSVALVNKPGGKQVVEVTGKDGKVIESLPADLNALHKTVEPMMKDEFLNRYSKLSPEFGLKKDEVDIKRKEANDKGVYLGAMANAYNSGTKGGGASGSKISNVEWTDDKGVKHKTPVIAQIGKTKDGSPRVQAFTLDGQPVNDSRIINALGSSGDETNTALSADLGIARERWKAGTTDHAGYQKEVQDVQRAHGATATDKASGLPKPGASFFGGDKSKPQAPSASEQRSAMPLSDEIGVHKTRGGVFFTVPGIETPFKTQDQAEAALAQLKGSRPVVKMNLPEGTINSALGYTN